MASIFTTLYYTTASSRVKMPLPSLAPLLQVLNLNSVANFLGVEQFSEEDGFVPKTMISVPIFNSQREVIGVAQLINKVSKKVQWGPGTLLERAQARPPLCLGCVISPAAATTARPPASLGTQASLSELLALMFRVCVATV